MVHKPLANGSQTKCVYVWMGLQTYAALSANGSHTIRCEPKLVGFLCERRELDALPCIECPLLASGSWKIN